MNYEEAEPYLVTYDIITLDERRKLYKEKSQDQIWYVIEKVSKGTKEAFYNFLKALEESKDDANHELMIHLQGQSTPLCQSEMLNTPDNSIQNELVFGMSPTGCITPSSHTSTSPISLSPQNFQSPSPPLRINDIASDAEVDWVVVHALPDEEVDWVVVHAQTDVKYNKNLALLMEHICNKITGFLTGTTYAQQIYECLIVPIKLAKEVYSQVDSQTEATCTTTAADEQIRCSYKLLMEILQKKSNSGINIDLHPILQEIGYSNDEAVLTDCSIECLIIAVEKLNQTRRQCDIL